MPSNPLKGAGYFLDGFGLMLKPGARRWVLIPLLLNLLLFTALIYYGAQYFELLTTRFEQWLPDWLDWLRWLLWPLFLLTVLLVVFFGFTLVANLISSPFNGLLAEAVERHLRGDHAPSSGADGGWGTLLRGMGAALADEVGKQWYYLTRLLPVLLLFFIPLLNLAFPLVWFLFGAWMLALEYNDYPMGNHELRFKEQRQRLGRKRLMSLGFGGAALFAATLPGLNLLAVPAGVAGATAMWLREFQDAT